MLAIEVKVDERSFKEAAHILRAIPRAVPRVFRRAFKRAVETTATDLKRRVGKQTVAKKGVIAKHISKRWSPQSGSVGADTKRLPLTAFSVSRRAHGISYRISKTAGRKTIKHGFLATVVGGELKMTAAEARTAAIAMGGEESVKEHHGVFARKGPSRLPIVEKKGPSIWWVITNTPGLLKACTDAAGTRMGKLINDQIGVEFRRWQKR